MTHCSSYTWCIKDRTTLYQIMNAKKGDKLSSGIINIANLKWQINIYPNGFSSDGSDEDAFQIYLQLISMPSSWSQVITTFRTYCHETLSRYTLIVRYKQGDDYGWPKRTCTLSEINRLAPKALNITISLRILRIILNDNLSIYPTMNSHHILSSKYNIIWTIPHSSVIHIFESSYNGKSIESDIYFSIFCLRMRMPSNAERGDVSLYLQLCSFPMNTSKIKIKFILSCIELNKSEESQLDFTLDESGWGWNNFCTLKQINKVNSSLTFHADIFILNQYDLHGNTVFINYHNDNNNDIRNHNNKLEKLSMNLIEESNKNNEILHKLECIQSEIKELKNRKIGNEKQEQEQEQEKEKEEKVDGDNKYKKAFCELIKFIKNPQPKYEYLSNKCDELKEFIYSQYDENSYKIESEKKNKDYFDCIMKYLLKNGENREDIFIINGNGNGNNTSTIHQSQLLRVYDIKNHNRIKKLNGEKGLKSLKKIYKGTVIGEYWGAEYLEHEFDATYHGTDDLQEINAYSFSANIQVDIPIGVVNYFTFNSKLKFEGHNNNNNKKRKLLSGDSNDNNHNKKRKLNDGKGMKLILDENECESESESDFEVDVKDNIKKVTQKFTIVINGKGAPTKSLLIYMNDCKKYLSFTNTTKMDEKYRNIDLVTVYVNGWPRIFAIASQDIKANKEILANYGSAYVGVRQHKMLYQDNMRYVQNKIYQICNDHNINTL